MNSESPSRRIFNITVSEILFVLIFAVTAAVIVGQVKLDSSIEEKDVLLVKFNELEKEFNILTRKFIELEKENKKLKEDVEILNEVIARLTAGEGENLGTDITKYREYIAKLEKQIERLKEIVSLRDETIRQFKGGTGFAKCTYGDIPIKQLFRANIYDEYFEVMPLWDLSDEETFLEIGWIKEMKTKKRYSTKEFDILGEKHLKWANSQSPSCRYHVRAYDRTENARLFLKQRDELDNKFIACHIVPESEDPSNRGNEKCRGFK